MFSSMIQNLLATGGQQASQQRALQLQGYTNNVNNKIMPAPFPNQISTTMVQPFQEVLQSSAQSQFGTLLANPTTSVQAQISEQPELRGYAQSSKPQLLSMISQISKKHGVDEKLVKALVQQESGFNPNAKSHCGAMGLMQLMPSTAKTLGVRDAYNPVQNVDGGVRHLKWLLSKYNGNVILALAAYNAGSGAVDKYKDVPPYAETQNYVKKILANYLG
ncbi:MAG: lytic transglycosylase domain-containing protein [bacterium]